MQAATSTLTGFTIDELFLGSDLIGCPRFCSGHGKCQDNGVCLCDSYYTGADCSQGQGFPTLFVDRFENKSASWNKPWATVSGGAIVNNSCGLLGNVWQFAASERRQLTTGATNRPGVWYDNRHTHGRLDVPVILNKRVREARRSLNFRYFYCHRTLSHAYVCSEGCFRAYIMHPGYVLRPILLAMTLTPSYAQGIWT